MMSSSAHSLRRLWNFQVFGERQLGGVEHVALEKRALAGGDALGGRLRAAA
jgi:hypothetical protein